MYSRCFVRTQYKSRISKTTVRVLTAMASSRCYERTPSTLVFFFFKLHTQTNGKKKGTYRTTDFYARFIAAIILYGLIIHLCLPYLVPLPDQSQTKQAKQNKNVKKKKWRRNRTVVFQSARVFLWLYKYACECIHNNYERFLRQSIESAMPWNQSFEVGTYILYINIYIYTVYCYYYCV